MRASESSKPLGMEIALVTPFVAEAHAKALAADAAELKEPEAKPWGQVVSYVRCLDGTLVSHMKKATPLRLQGKVQLKTAAESVDLLSAELLPFKIFLRKLWDLL
jgi:hypothetical protein